MTCSLTFLLDFQTMNCIFRGLRNGLQRKGPCDFSTAEEQKGREGRRGWEGMLVAGMVPATASATWQGQSAPATGQEKRRTRDKWQERAVENGAPWPDRGYLQKSRGRRERARG